MIIEVLVEASKARHNKKEHDDGSTSHGDFDPDNAGPLSSIFGTYQNGLMVDVRQLLTPKEAGAGGKFIKAIQKLTTDDFIKYYKNNTSGSTSIPPLLFIDFINTREKDKSIQGADFIDNNRMVIEAAVDKLVAKARAFQSKNYFDKIVVDYQAYEFHKDSRPEKYDVREEDMDFPFSNGKMTVRRRKSSVEIKSITACLNDFAEIVTIYQRLVGKNTSFLSSNVPLDTYVQQTFAVFAKDIPESTQKKTVQSVVTHLHKSIDIAGWDHSNIVL